MGLVFGLVGWFGMDGVVARYFMNHNWFWVDGMDGVRVAAIGYTSTTNRLDNKAQENTHYRMR